MSALLLTLLVAGGCSQAGNLGQAIPSVGAEVVLKDVVVDVGEAKVRILLTPAELRSLADAIDAQGQGQGSN